MFTTGIITDEVSQDIAVAAAFAVRHGMSFVDIRSSANKKTFDLTKDDWKQISSVCKDNGLSVRCIDAPLFKCSISDTDTVTSHVENFRRLVEFAVDIGCSVIRGFDFWAEGASVERRAEAFGPIVDICGESGRICVLESDPSVHASTAAELRRLLDAVGSPCIKALFDPGNAFWVNPEADCISDYELLRGRIGHIHLKDAVIKNGHTEAFCIGNGLVGYEKLLNHIAGSYDGGLAIETHYRKKSELTDRQLQLPGGSAFTDGAYEASEECADALNKLIERVMK